MRKKRVIIDLYFKRGKYLLYLINERVKSGERREDIIKDIYVFCPSLEAVKIAINTIGLDPDHVIKYTNIFNDDLDGYIKWLKEMIEIDKLGLNRVISDNCELFCIQNPPYNGSLHLNFFEVGIDLIGKFNGRMVIIEPATWLINVRKNGNTVKKYDAIKNRINGHVESVVIENLNKEFNTVMYMPFAITTIDMSKTFDTIKYTCCGYTKHVKSIYDCNLIGEYNIIWSIFKKVQSFEGGIMKSHITNKNQGDNFYYLCFQKDCQSVLCQLETPRIGMNYETSDIWIETENGNIEARYISSMLHKSFNNVSNKPHCKLDKGKNITDKIADNIYGSQIEMENWKNFILNNKLSIFLSFCVTYDMHMNNLDDFLPWLVDKQYTDDEINKLFGFTDEEIKLIDTTIKKYEKNSPWFKRYMCGKNGATDEEVTEYIKKITEEC